VKKVQAHKSDYRQCNQRVDNASFGQRGYDRSACICEASAWGFDGSKRRLSTRTNHRERC
jgi:hypothetical protein